MKLPTSILAGIILLSQLLLAGSAVAASPPNIIFVMADDMGYADAGCFGGKHIRTPHIDRLAEQGTRFTDCYAGSTVCAPSRSVLMTGLHTGHTRVRGNFGVGGVTGIAGGKGRVPLHDEDLTVAEVLQQTGYATGMTGKWGLGEPNTTGEPLDQGFDTWFGFLNQRRAHDHYANSLWLNRKKFALVGNDKRADAKQEQLYTHDLFTGFALNFIRSQQAGPFFLYVPYTVPHAGFQVPDLGQYAQESWTSQEKAYAAMITRMDEHIGRIMQLLQELKIDENTIVFFCSDNGAADRYDHLFKSSGPLRGRKRDMYEGGLRTPMVVRWPNRVPAGRVSDAVWSFADFLPTAADLANAKDGPKKAWPPNDSPGIDGLSILPTLLGESQPEFSERYLYWEFFEKGFQQAARWKHWKAVRKHDDEDHIELYDLHADLGESNDVSASHSAIVRQFRNYFASARTESAEWPLKK